MSTIHDEECEADWGAEGQESPCLCWERADRRASYASLGAQVATVIETMEALTRAFTEVSQAFAAACKSMQESLDAARTSRPALPPGLHPEKHMIGRVYITDTGAAWNVAPGPDGTYHWEPCQWQKN